MSSAQEPHVAGVYLTGQLRQADIPSSHEVLSEATQIT